MRPASDDPGGGPSGQGPATDPPGSRLPGAPPRALWASWYDWPDVREWDVTPRPGSASTITLSEQIDITGSNILGNVHGGTLMKLVDTAGGLAAMKHCGGPVVTVAMDEMTFLEPVYVGDVVTVRAMVNDAGTSSLEVGVRVEAESPRTGRRVHTSSAYLVYVALDRDGRPRPVPPVVAETDEERQRQREAKVRRAARLSRKEAILKARAEKGEPWD